MKWIGELYASDEKAGGDREKMAELRRTESASPESWPGDSVAHRDQGSVQVRRRPDPVANPRGSRVRAGET
jgi:hypothetical protein